MNEQTPEDVDNIFLRIIGTVALTVCIATGTILLVWAVLAGLGRVDPILKGSTLASIIGGAVLLFGATYLIWSKLPPVPPQPVGPPRTPRAIDTYLLAGWAASFWLNAAYGSPDSWYFGGSALERGAVSLFGAGLFALASWNAVCVIRHQRSGARDVGEGWQGWVVWILILGQLLRGLKGAPWSSIGWVVGGTLLAAGLLQFVLSRTIGRPDAHPPSHPG